MVTYVGATFELAGFVLERLNFVRTFLAQIAGSFVALVTSAAVGGVALNIRYLRKANVSLSDAGSSVGVSQVIAITADLVHCPASILGVRLVPKVCASPAAVSAPT